MSEILLGTCGWSYAEWEGILYPYAQSKLKQYSSIFPPEEFLLISETEIHSRLPRSLVARPIPRTVDKFA